MRFTTPKGLQIVYRCSLLVADRLYIVYRRSPLGPVDPSIRALSGRLKFTVQRHKAEESERVILLLMPGPFFFFFMTLEPRVE